MLLNGYWRMNQNCMISGSAQFLHTNHGLVVATLKLQLKSVRMVLSQPWLDDSKLNDEREAEEFVNRLSGDFGGLGVLGTLKSCGELSVRPSLMLQVDVLERRVT